VNMLENCRGVLLAGRTQLGRPDRYPLREALGYGYAGCLRRLTLSPRRGATTVLAPRTTPAPVSVMDEGRRVPVEEGRRTPSAVA
jgi:hypothetical protein